MQNVDYYTGEALSPTTIAAQNASFGSYYYDPNKRTEYQQYNYQPDQNIYNPYMNQQYGYNYQQPYGYNPYMQQQNYYGYNPYMQQQNGFNQYMNQPVMSIGWNNNRFNYNYNLPEKVERTVRNIPPQFTSEYMADENTIKRLDNLAVKYTIEQIEEEEINNINRQQFNNYGYNYYNTPYYNTYNNSSVYRKAMQELEEIKEECRQRKNDFMVRMCMTANNYLGNGITEEEVRRNIEGYTVVEENPYVIRQMYNIPSEMDKYSRLVPYNDPTPQIYANIDAAASNLYHKYIPENATMEEYNENIGLYMYELKMKEIEAESRDYSGNFNSNIFKKIIRKRARDRYNNSKGYNNIINNNTQYAPVGVPRSIDAPFGTEEYNNDNRFNTLRDSATMSEDGTINIVYNFNGQADKINKENEEYQKDKERFKSFLNSIPRSIYDKPDSGGANDGQ